MIDQNFIKKSLRFFFYFLRNLFFYIVSTTNKRIISLRSKIPKMNLIKNIGKSRFINLFSTIHVKVTTKSILILDSRDNKNGGNNRSRDQFILSYFVHWKSGITWRNQHFVVTLGLFLTTI